MVFLLCSYYFSVICIFSNIGGANTNTLYLTLFELIKRYFEIFSLFWAILILISILYLINVLKPLFRKFLYKITKKEKSIKNRKNRVKYSYIIPLFLIILGSMFHLSIYPRHFYGVRYMDDEQTDAVLWIGNYFYENPLEEEESIYVIEVPRNWLYSLFHNDKLTVISFTEDMFNNYTIFISMFNEDVRFILVEKFEVENLNGTFYEDFDTIYENSKYIFSEIRDL